MNLLLKNRELALGLIIGVMVIGIGLYAPAFVSPDNLAYVLDDTSILFMMAMAQMMVILTRGIDLSVASNLALSGMMSASLAQYYPELPVIAYIALAVACGTVLGLFNGGLISYLGIPPIAMTLGTLAVYRGLIVVYDRGNQVNASEMGDVFQNFPKTPVMGVTATFWIMVVLAIAIWVFLGQTRTGRTGRVANHGRCDRWLLAAAGGLPRRHGRRGLAAPAAAASRLADALAGRAGRQRLAPRAGRAVCQSQPGPVGGSAVEASVAPGADGGRAALIEAVDRTALMRSALSAQRPALAHSSAPADPQRQKVTGAAQQHEHMPHQVRPAHAVTEQVKRAAQ